MHQLHATYCITVTIAIERFKEYSPEVRAELPQTKVADSQPSPRAGRPEGLVELSANEVWTYPAHPRALFLL